MQALAGRPSTDTGERPGAFALPASTAASATIDAWLDEYVATSVPGACRSTYGVSIATVTSAEPADDPPSP